MEFQEPLPVCRRDEPYKSSHLPQSLITLQEGGTETCTLRMLPPELRLVIYEALLGTGVVWTTPRLLIALRPDQKLYHEALEVFYKARIFRLSTNSWKGLYSMGGTAIKGIRKVIIDSIRPGIHRDYSMPPCLVPYRESSGSIQEIYFTFFPYFKVEDRAEMLCAVAKWTRHLRSVKKISVTAPRREFRGVHIENTLHVVSRWLGVQRKLSRVTSVGHLEWIWLAPDGEVLLWKNPEI